MLWACLVLSVASAAAAGFAAYHALTRPAGPAARPADLGRHGPG